MWTMSYICSRIPSQITCSAFWVLSHQCLKSKIGFLFKTVTLCIHIPCIYQDGKANPKFLIVLLGELLCESLENIELQSQNKTYKDLLQVQRYSLERSSGGNAQKALLGAEGCWNDLGLLILIFILIGQKVQSELGSIPLSDRHAGVKAHLSCQADYRYLMGLLIHLCILH